MMLSGACLVLFPCHAGDWQSGMKPVVGNFISESGLGVPASDGWLEGEAFGDLIVFMGCSPVIGAQVGQPGSVSRIRTDININQLRFYSLVDRLNARCPECRKRLPKSALVSLSLSRRCASVVECAGCDWAGRFDQLVWKSTGGFAHASIVIADIFPFEAIPQKALLQGLEEATGVSWNYCYADNCIECDETTQ